MSNDKKRKRERSRFDQRQQIEPPQAANYAGEAVGGYGVAGSRHEPPAQDALWPLLEFSQMELPFIKFLLSGRLYLLADGVTLCADGHEASRLAVETVSKAYYKQPGHAQDPPDQRNQSLTDAFWEANKVVQQWDEKFFCWRKEYHPRQHVTAQEVQKWRGEVPLCPKCGKFMAGLQTTSVGMVLRGRNLVLVRVGDSAALRLPANPSEPVEFLSYSEEASFLGMPTLSYHDLHRRDIQLQPGDCVVLCGDGVIDVLEGWQQETGQNWREYLRQQLDTSNLKQAVKRLICQLDQFRNTKAPHLDDDLTLLAVAIPDEATLTRLRNNVRQARHELNRLRQANHDKLKPDQYEELIQALEALLLHEDDKKLWQQYAEALRERALAQIRKVGRLDDPDALKWMKLAAQVDDGEAHRWKRVMLEYQQLASWHEKKQLSLLATATIIEHERWIHDFVELRLNVPEVIADQQDFFQNIIAALKAENKSVAPYEALLQRLHTVIEERKAEKRTIELTSTPTEALPPIFSWSEFDMTEPTEQHFTEMATITEPTKENMNHDQAWWSMLRSDLLNIKHKIIIQITFYKHKINRLLDITPIFRRLKRSAILAILIFFLLIFPIRSIIISLTWTPKVAVPVTGHPVLIEMTLDEANLSQPGLDQLITAYFGHVEHGQIKNEREMAQVRRDINGERSTIRDKNQIHETDSIRSLLPADPLFLFVGRIAETEVVADGIRFNLSLPNSSEEPRPQLLVKVSDRDERAEQQNIEMWQEKHDSWVWMLASSPSLTNALQACRDSSVQNQRHGVEGNECLEQQAFATGEKRIDLEAVVLIEIEDGVLGDSLLGDVTFEDHWIYADLGQHGLQLGRSRHIWDDYFNWWLNPWLNPWHEVIGEAKDEQRLGIVRASWNGKSITPSDILQLQRQENGVYKLIWSKKGVEE